MEAAGSFEKIENLIQTQKCSQIDPKQRTSNGSVYVAYVLDDEAVFLKSLY
jgi:hypothetical protein